MLEKFPVVVVVFLVVVATAVFVFVVVVVVGIMFRPLINFIIPAKRLQLKYRVISEAKLSGDVVLL
jgi:hypothetical protein